MELIKDRSKLKCLGEQTWFTALSVVSRMKMKRRHVQSAASRCGRHDQGGRMVIVDASAHAEDAKRTSALDSHMEER